VVSFDTEHPPATQDYRPISLTNHLPAVAGPGWLDLDEAAMSIEAPVPTSVDESDKVK